MDSDLKRGAVIGALFAGVAYLLTYRLGFNPDTLTYLLYLYILLGAAAAFDFAGFVEDRGFLDRLVIVAEEEERKLKKVFSDEEYRVEGTVEKVEG